MTIVILGFAVVIALQLRQRPSSGSDITAEQLTSLESGLKTDFQRATTDMADRIARVKGDLQLELGDRLQKGLLDSRTELARNLETNSKALQSRLDGLEQKTTASLESIRGRVDEKLTAISDQVQTKLTQNIQEGFAHFKAVQEHLKAAEEQLRNVGAVGSSINELNSLLKLPHLRGKFGEAELSRLLADFLPAAAFEEQVAIAPGSREMVDAVVKFPRYKLPIDSKFNREAILPLFETNDPAQLNEARAQLATAIKTQARSIAEKYIHPEHGTTDLALMFLPSETIYFEVIRDGALLAAVHKLKVFPVSPNTLVIALRSIEMSLSHYEQAKGVEKTLEQIRLAQKHFGNFQKKFEDVGEGLERAQKAYAIATNHLARFEKSTIQLTGEETPELPESAPPAG